MGHEAYAAFRLRYLAADEEVRRTFARAVEAEREFVAAVVRANASSAFGKAHGFEKIRSLDDFRAAVPIHEYDDLSSWIERAAQGEANVLTTAPVLMFRRTSGTTGASKKIPVNAPSLSHHVMFRCQTFGAAAERFSAVRDDLDSLLNLQLHPRPPEPERTAGGLVWQPMSESLAQELAPGGRMWGLPGSQAPWYDPGRTMSTMDLRYYRLRRALEGNIRALVAVNPSTVVAIAEDIRARADELLADIAAGTAFGERCAEPNPRRAKEIEVLLARSPRVCLREIWPELLFVKTWKSAACALYLPWVREVTGEGVEIIPFPYMASEGFHLALLDDHPVGGFQVPVGDLFEYLPTDEKTKTLLSTEVEVGREYGVIMTSQNGLYRYALGDIVRVLEKVNGWPRIEFVGRRGSSSSFTGEKLTEAQVVRAATRAFQATGVDVSLFTCCPIWARPPYYAFVLEAREQLAPATLEIVAAALERELDAANDEYGSKRKSGRLGPVAAHGVRRGTFVRYRDRVALRRRVASVQTKHVVLQKDGNDALGELLALSDAD